MKIHIDEIHHSNYIWGEARDQDIRNKEVKMNKKADCKGCGETFEKRLLSQKGYCFLCGLERMTKAQKQMMEKKGHFYERWKVSYVIGMEKYLEKLKKGKESNEK